MTALPPTAYTSIPMHADLLSIADLDDATLLHLVELAGRYRAGLADRPLEGRSVALLFEKPSLRTKVSFDIGVHELGGHAVYLGREEVGLNTREPARDVARVLERWCCAIVARVFDHATLRALAAAAAVPVINALSDLEHPCQALADLATVQQRFGRLEGVTVAFVGDGNNVARSLALACAGVGAAFRIASPPAFALEREWVDAVNARYGAKGPRVEAFDDPVKAVAGADVVYTDVWTSMGQETEAAERRKAFAGFQVDNRLLDHAAPGVILLHDMPAHYGEEVPPGMLDSPRSAAFDQAENRLHAQKAALRLLVAGE